jgi:uncharacterized OB-fold protein
MYTPAEWRMREAAEQFTATECQSCGYVSFPDRRQTCKRCGEVDPGWESVELERRGEVLSYVVQNRLPEAFDTPLPIGVVDVPQSGPGEPARVYGLFTETDPEDVEVGLEVEADFRKIYEVDGLPTNSFKFKLPRGEQ